MGFTWGYPYLRSTCRLLSATDGGYPLNDNISPEPQDFYSSHSVITDPGKQSILLDGLSSEIAELCKMIQGIILHVFLSEKYGVHLPEDRKQEANLRFISMQIARIVACDSSPLHQSRSLENRLLGTCRDFSVWLCAALRHQGIPARARCGFATYFEPDKFVDHWVCEYWNADRQQWVMIDAQLDEFQCDMFNIHFDPLDVPTDKFLTGGRAWQMCRKEHADPDAFGVFDMHGLWFVRGNVVRDLASLNKIELLPWDCWGLIEGDDEHLSSDDFALLDQVAWWTHPDTFSLPAVCAIYQENSGLCVSPIIKSFIGGGFQQVDLTAKKT